MTELSLPMELHMTGWSLSATATRRIWMLFRLQRLEMRQKGSCSTLTLRIRLLRCCGRVPVRGGDACCGVRSPGRAGAWGRSRDDRSSPQAEPAEIKRVPAWYRAPRWRRPRWSAARPRHEQPQNAAHRAARGGRCRARPSVDDDARGAPIDMRSGVIRRKVAAGRWAENVRDDPAQSTRLR